MVVIIRQAGNDRRPAKIHEARILARHGPDLGGGSGHQELFALDGESLLNVGSRVHRHDLPVVEDRIGRREIAQLPRSASRGDDEQCKEGQTRTHRPLLSSYASAL